jgi:hypothetical protein
MPDLSSWDLALVAEVERVTGDVGVAERLRAVTGLGDGEVSVEVYWDDEQLPPPPGTSWSREPGEPPFYWLTVKDPRA